MEVCVRYTKPFHHALRKPVARLNAKVEAIGACWSTPRPPPIDSTIGEASLALG